MPSMSGKQGPRYWRSLNELADKPEFRALVEREFPPQASEMLALGGESRRTFLKIMGASVALAGLASCRRWPGEELVPYAHRPPGRMDGVPVHYATACEVAGLGIGLIAISFDGRPIKVDGHPAHPLTMGGSDRFVQASVLNVYDPDRSHGVVQRVHGQRKDFSDAADSGWGEFVKVIQGAGLGADGAGLVVLAEAMRSPSVAAMRRKLSKAQWFEWEPVSEDNQRAGAQLAFGKPFRAVPQLDKASVIVAIDADLFHGEPLRIKFNRDFSAGRRLRDARNFASAEMNRLYVIEGGFSITGSMADHRVGVRPSAIATAVQALAHEVSAGLADAVTNVPVELAGIITVAARDLLANKGRAVVVAGSQQPPEIHALVAGINAALNAPLDYYDVTDDPRGAAWTPHAEQIKAFAGAIPQAKAVLVLGANPALTAPADLALEAALGKCSLSVHAGTHEDETARACGWHVPLAHFLEAWGDVRTFDGTVSITQPLIEPIFGGKSAIEILALLTGQAQRGYDIVRETARTDYLNGRFSEWTWKKALFDGMIGGTAWARQAPGTPAAIKLAPPPPAGGGDYELALIVGGVHDGRYANNGWLQELPDPMTRVSWDNPLIVSPATARELSVDGDDVVNVTVGETTAEATIFVLAGQPDRTLSLALGYGRQEIGSVADDIGVNAYAFRTSKDGPFRSAKVVPVSPRKVKPLACVQDHHVIDAVGKNRMIAEVPELVVEGTLEQYRRKPALGTRKVVSLSMFDEHSYAPGQPHLMARWGMAVDLTTCTGCSACVIACQAENNIPVVGREMVWRGREMHWLRIDRYFKWGRSSTDQVLESAPPQAVHQPVLCMMCENAPCEEVCPVGATTHSHEGLNMMTYNRCIGTRYCSNNCPYKVRRFNFFDYNSGTRKNLYVPNLLRDDISELEKMQKNPQVTVRSRGVMEKCSYCVQRIENERIRLLAENRSTADKIKFADGSVVTACQQACPTQALVFGDLNDKDSRVARLHALQQSYGLLDPDLNTKPRTRYLAKVRNPAQGLDPHLYNEFTASEGFEYESAPEGGKAPHP